MGCASSKEDKEPTLVGGGTDGWAAGSPAPKQPPNPARPHLPHTSVDSLATSSNGTATARQAAAPPPSQPTRQSKQQAAAGAAPAVALADVELREDVDGVHSFSAYVLADFEASVLGVELSVKKGEWVAVTVDGDDEPPEGWCMCRVTRPADGDSYGLVPWSYLVSAAHAELKAAADGVETSAEAGAADGTEELGLRLERGEDGAFGLDIDDLNCVRRTSPGGAAERSSQIRVGDVVIAVDGAPPHP